MKNTAYHHILIKKTSGWIDSKRYGRMPAWEGRAIALHMSDHLPKSRWQCISKSRLKVRVQNASLLRLPVHSQRHPTRCFNRHEENDHASSARVPAPARNMPLGVASYKLEFWGSARAFGKGSEGPRHEKNGVFRYYQKSCQMLI